jgi:hypothetical protein
MKLEQEILDAARSVARRKQEIIAESRKAKKIAKLTRESINVFGSRLAPLDFHDKPVRFTDKWT